MAMRYLSVCSGIEAATVAWHPLGWNPVAFSEIEKFPSAVLAHHWPDVPNLGDMNDFRQWPVSDIDLLVGGTPCQSFSVAGLRQGLAVRRLTPLECERLQGFPDGFTNIPGASDSGRYKALGNSIAVPVMHRIGRRISAVDAIPGSGD